MKAPPNRKPVTVILDGEPITVMAVYEEGYLPHWRTPDDAICWPPEKFKEWVCTEQD